MASIFKGISDVVTANINDLVDRVEDPERYGQAAHLGDGGESQQAKEGLVDAIASEKRLQEELELNRGKCEAWGKNAEQALRNGNEALARNALVREKEHEAVYRALEAKLEEARRKRSALVARQRAAEARQQIDQTLSAFDAPPPWMS